MKTASLILGLVLLIIHVAFIRAETLAEAMGYPKGSKLLIVNADDFGMCHSENLGTFKVLEYGIVRSTTLMVPCPWAFEAVNYARQKKMNNIGVHACLTSEWKHYKWRPVNVTSPSSLVDNDGFMWQSTIGAELNVKLPDAWKEIHAQLTTAIKTWGLNLSHYDSHMGTMYGLLTGRKDLLAMAFAFSYEFGLPFRVPYVPQVAPFRELGFAILDDLILGGGEPGDFEGRKAHFIKLIKNLKPGVTEIYIHPALASDELKAITNSWKARQLDVDVFTHPDVKAAIQEAGVQLISFEPLRKYQREKMNWHSGFKAEDVYDKYKQILEKQTTISIK